MRARVTEGVQRAFHPVGTARQMLAIVADGDRSALLRKITHPTRVITTSIRSSGLPSTATMSAK